MNDLEAARPSGRHAHIARYFGRNVLSMVGADFLWGVGRPFVDWMLLLPVMLGELRTTPLVAELPSAAYAVTFGLFSTLAAYWFHGRGRRTLACALLYLGHGVLWMAAGVLILMVRASDPTPYVVIVMTTCVLGNIVLCLGYNQDMYLLIDSIPQRRRGLTYALRQAGLVLGILLGASVVRVVLRQPASTLAEAVRPFGWCFLIGGGIFGLATVPLAAFKEAPASQHWYGGPLWGFVSTEIRAMWSRRAFRWLFVSNVLSGAVAFGLTPLVGLYAKDLLGESKDVVAQFIQVVILSTMATALVGGVLGDRFGYKPVGVLALVCLGATCALCWMLRPAHSQWVYLAFVGLGAVQALGPLARMQFVKELFPDKDVSVIHAMELLMMLPLAALGPLGLGLLAHLTGRFRPVFALGLALTLASMVILVWRVEDPRRRGAGSAPADGGAATRPASGVTGRGGSA